MRLLDSEPRWSVDSQRRRIGVSFLCPCRRGELCEHAPSGRIYIPFSNPLDGAPAQNGWTRSGETFADLSLHPSISARDRFTGQEHWHGHLIGGVLKKFP